MAKRKPRCIIIAGPNGAGRTTFAREFLPKDAGILHFVNADLIAAGLSPLDPPAAQVAAARILLEELDRLAKARVDFAFETTLSGRTYLDRIKNWRESGYLVELVFLKLSHVDIALKRVLIRVKQGGHFVPESDVRRRFQRGVINFEVLYKAAADRWALYDNSGSTPRLVERSNG
ncbi:MAG: zeta toxin family protein [Flavobacteriales bacterium]